MDLEYADGRTFVRVRLSRDYVDMGWWAFEGVRKQLLSVGSRELVWQYCEENWAELVAVFELLPPVYLTADRCRGEQRVARDWRREEPRVARDCSSCGRRTSSQPSDPEPECLDCSRARHGLDDSRWFTPIGTWHPTVPIVRPGELPGIPLKRPVAVRGIWPEHDPEPETTTREGLQVSAPQAVAKLGRAAREAGFEVRMGVARGWARAVKIGTYRHLDSVGVALLGHGWRVHAVYARTVGAKSWAWRSIAIWGVTRPQRFGYATITDLSQFVALRGNVGPAWFKSIYAREMAK